MQESEKMKTLALKNDTSKSKVMMINMKSDEDKIKDNSGKVKFIWEKFNLYYSITIILLYNKNIYLFYNIMYYRRNIL